MDNDNNSITEAVTEITDLPPSSDNPKEKKFCITFENFRDLPSESGQEVQSSVFTCFRAEFCVVIFPGGDEDDDSSDESNFFDEDSDNDDECVEIGIRRCDEGEGLSMKYSLGIKNTTANVLRTLHKGAVRFRSGDNWWHVFEPRDDILKDYLEGGALKVYVTMQLGEYIPKNPTSRLILNLFCQQESADIVFEVQQQKRTGNRKKRAKTSSVTYHAHRLILQQYSTEIAALCATSEGLNPIIVTDVKPEVFRHFLYYLYGGQISEDEFVEHSKDLINIADKYGVTNLKLESEVWYVHSTTFSMHNLIDNLLYADATNCALLKEVLMDFIVENKEEVLRRVCFDDVPGHVCRDLLSAMARRDNVVARGVVEDDEVDMEMIFNKMRIGELREKLDEKGLDIDGSREALIATLRDSF